MKNTNYRLTFLLVALCFLTTSARGQQQQQLVYSPADDITIDCGVSGKSTTSGNWRSWDGDIDSKYFPLDVAGNRNSVTMDGVVESSWLRSEEPVPYKTARLSNSTFTYIIPVTPGPKFLRLYFSAYSYQGFNSSAGFFSVGVGRYTLLSNFSAYLAAGQQDDELGVRREFLLTPERSSLNVTFTPSPSGFAFVSGIEVVSMPSELYYHAGGEMSVVMVGEENRYYTLQNSMALETMYRINVGSSAIPPNQDTGMFREWDGPDDDYLSIPGPSVLPVNLSEPLRFRSNLSSYAAPAAVYSTGRSTGDASHTKEEIRAYNLTWEFPVDSGFAYLVRLHFCEIETEFTRQGDRVFNIFIDGRYADRNFDVLANVEGRYVPYFRDYVIFKLGGEQGKRINLSVALQANPVDADSAYVDAILNGLEIFKLSNTTGSLAGPNPDPRAVSVPTEPTARKRKNRTAMIAGAASGVILLLLGLIGLFVILRRGKRIRDSGGSGKASWWGPISFATTAKSTKSRGSTTLPSELCRHFSLAEIRAATNNFDDVFIIGVGGFGNVYKGYIDSGTTAVAIKRLKSESSQGAREFTTEIEMLSHLRHRHLVSLIGYCDDRGEMILVYEYMSRGTLRDHLYKSDNPPMTWRRRLEACVGAARGLHYLHTGAKLTVIHRDVKTTNILLDDAFVAKVSDFGLSKTGPTTTSKGHVTTVVKGSIGYLDPEYYRRQQLSEKSDVYSFGVVLCEVLAGRPPILRTAAERSQVSLAEWARSCHRNGTLSEIVDPNLAGKIAPECLKKYGEIAISCMLDDGADRPSMNDVVWGLEFAIQLQQNSEESGGGDVAAKGEEETALIDGVSDSDGTFSCSWDDSSGVRSSGATKFSSTENGSSTGDSMKVFSEIYDPKAR